MKRIFIGLMALGVCLTPVTVPLMTQPSWGQTQNSQVEEARRLLEQARQEMEQGQHRQAIQTLQQVLAMAQQLNEKKLEGTAWLGMGLNYKKMGQYQQSLDDYKQALLIFREVPDRVEEADALNNIGLVYLAFKQPQQALEHFNQALAIFQQVNDRFGEAVTLNSIGGVYQTMGQPQQALKYYNQSLRIRQATNDRAGAATTLINIGGIYHAVGQMPQALEAFKWALPIFQEVSDRSGEAITLNNIGEIYYDFGQQQQALNYFNQALKIRMAVGDLAGKAATLNNIGAVYSAIGQPQQALEYYNQALPIVIEINDRAGKAKTLSNLGAFFEDTGQLEQALDYYKQTLPIFKEVGDPSGEAAMLNNIGRTYRKLGQPDQALDYYNQALSIISMAAGNSSTTATALSNIGAVYSATGQPQQALKKFSQALSIFQQVGDRSGESTTLNNIGAAYHTMGELQKALEYYNQSLPIAKEVGDRSGVANTLSNIAFVYRDRNRPTEAIANWEQSVKIILEIRGGLQRKNRQQFLQANHESATALIDLLIDQKQDNKAFEWVNLFTATDLADYTRLINTKVANPQAQQALDEWNQKNQRLEFLRQKQQDNLSAALFKSEVLFQQIRKLEAQVYQQAEDISRRFPEVAELLETTPTDIAKLQSSIPAGTVVVKPVLLTNVKNVPNTIAIFVLTKDKLSVVKTPINPNQFDQLLTQYGKQLRNDGDANYSDTSKKLYDILIRPVEDKIQAFSPKQLSIIATDKLRYIPFETLYDSKTNQFLIQKYPVNYLTRLSSHSLQLPGVQKLSSPQEAVLALGNPVPRNPQNLPETEKEVKAITQLLPGSAAYLRNEATLNTFKTQALRFPFLHLATHGCFQPEGCKKLGMEANTLLFADQQWKIADAALLGLKDTQLLTLSACQTAQETNSNGEGIAGVAYIFERAGAKAVMASLWNVEEESTKQLMIQFYENLKQGMSKGEALRQAKLKQIGRHPFYWSPFILIGDAR